MPPPWQPSTSKTIRTIDHKFQALPAGRTKPVFSAPSCPKSLTFTGLALFAGMARCAAQSHMPPRVIAALAVASKAIVSEFVDDSPPEFWFTNDIEKLGDSRPSISGDIAAGFAYLVLAQLQCVYSSHGRQLIRKGQAPDFVFSGPPGTGNDIVLVEAKANISATMSPRSLETTVQDGYDRQIEPFIGAVLGGAQVLHGYAVGFGGQPGNPSTSRLHIIESGTPVTVPAFTPPGDRMGTHTEPLPLMTHLILENYRAVLALLGQNDFVSIIDAVRTGEVTQRVIDNLLVVAASAGGRIERSIAPLDGTEGEILLGLDGTVFQKLLRQVAEIAVKERVEFDLPVLSALGFSEGSSIQCPDGFKVTIAEIERETSQNSDRLHPRTSRRLRRGSRGRTGFSSFPFDQSESG